MIKIIKLFFGLLTFLLLFTSCTSNKKKVKELTINSITEINSNLSPTFEYFQIKGDKETILKGKKGTSIYIPANIFQFEDGSNPTTLINIELKECYSIKDMIFENLQTSSEDKILETKGIIYVNAEANGKKLCIKEGNALVLGFPRKGSKKEMDLFYDFKINDSLNTWIPDYKFFETKSSKESLSSIDTTNFEGDISFEINYPIEITEDLYDYGYWVSLRTGTFHDLKLLGSDITIMDYIDNLKNVDSTKAYKFYKNNWEVTYDFNIDKNGKMFNFRPGSNKYNREALKIVKELLASAPPFDVLSYKEGIEEGWDYALGIRGSYKINWDKFKRKFRKKYSNYTNKAIQKIDPNELEYYMFSATEMGWINCDRFWDVDENEKTDFIVKTNNPSETNIKIVFKDIKSIMNGKLENGNLVFKNIPKGKRIKIIGISHSNGKPTLAIEETTTDSKNFKLTNFKEFTLDQLETELNKLN